MTDRTTITIDITDGSNNSKTTPIGWDAQLIKNAKIMVIGAGALGNEVLKNLALVGVKNILIVDFDFVERTNLAKSVLYRERDCTGDKRKVDIARERLKDISPDLKIMTINGDATQDIGLGLLKEMEVVISCLDNRLTRMWVNRMCFAMGKSWIDGGIMDMEGQVDVYNADTNCYECGLGPRALENIQYRNGCVNRMKRYASAGFANTNCIVASVVGAIQAQEALKIVADPSRSLAGHQFCFNGRTNYYDKLGKVSPRRPECGSHEIYKPLIQASELSAESSIENTLHWLSEHFNTENISINLYYYVILSVVLGTSGKEKNFIKARPRISQIDLDALREVEDEEVRFKDKTQAIDKTFPQPQLKLNDIGIPHYHVIRVIVEGKKYYVELSGDKEFMKFQ